MENKKQSTIITAVIIAVLVGVLGYFGFVMTKADTSSVGKEKVDYTSGTTIGYNLNQKTFTLTHPKEWYPMPKDSATWGQKMENNDITGTLMWYFVTGEERLLTNPYIQVSYVSKKAPSSSTVDSIYIWLDKVILQSEDSKVLRNKFDIPLANGKILQCKEYSWGKRTISAEQKTFIDSKYVAFAYMDYDDKYWLALNLTTKQQDKFERYLPNFYYIAKSFK